MDSFLKNPEFAWRPTSERLEHLKLLNNDYYGVLQFNILYHIVYYKKKFINLKSIEFEQTFIQFLIELKDFHQLEQIVLINKGTFFNLK